MNASEAAKPAARALRDDAQLSELLRSFRLMLLQHGRVVIHQSEALDMGATDIRALAFLSSTEGDSTPKQVAEFLELSTGATTSLVDRLVGAGTLVREPHPTDRRSVILRLTPEGYDAVASLADVYRCALARVIPESSYAEMSTLFLEVATALTAGSGCFDPSTR